MAFYNADLFPAWKAACFMRAAEHDARPADAFRTKIIDEEPLLADSHARISDARVGWMAWSQC